MSAETDDPRTWSAATLEKVLIAALGKGDMQGIDAALRLMTVKDPRRAQELYDTLKVGLLMAKEATR